MELTYQSPLMPASYTALSADEMTYIDGGAIQIGSYLIEFHPEALLQSVVNFTINFGQLLGKVDREVDHSLNPLSYTDRTPPTLSASYV